MKIDAFQDGIAGRSVQVIKNEDLFSIFAVMTDIVFGKDYRKERITI